MANLPFYYFHVNLRHFLFSDFCNGTAHTLVLLYLMVLVYLTLTCDRKQWQQSDWNRTSDLQNSLLLGYVCLPDKITT